MEQQTELINNKKDYKVIAGITNNTDHHQPLSFNDDHCGDTDAIITAGDDNESSDDHFEQEQQEGRVGDRREGETEEESELEAEDKNDALDTVQCSTDARNAAEAAVLQQAIAGVMQQLLEKVGLQCIGCVCSVVYVLYLRCCVMCYGCSLLEVLCL